MLQEFIAPVPSMSDMLVFLGVRFPWAARLLLHVTTINKAGAMLGMALECQVLLSTPRHTIPLRRALLSSPYVPWADPLQFTSHCC
jgi:hypothetical protein